MQELVDMGFYWSDIAPVSIRFNNYLGGVYPEMLTRVNVVPDCSTQTDTYLGATEWDTLVLVKLPDPPISLAEVSDETDETKMSFEWEYPEDDTWELADFYASGTEPSNTDGGSPITHYSIYYYDLTQTEHSRLDRQTEVVEYLASDPTKTSISLTKGT